MPGDVLVVSPHCDDAVFSCGELLLAHRRSSVVVTIFAGGPPRGAALSAWDAAAGFGPSDDVRAARRDEDRAALALLGATPMWLDFRDAQYGPSPDADTIAATLAQVVATLRPRQLVLPLGLFHSDHDLAHRATLALLEHARGRTVLWYEDAIYRRLPGLVGSRLRQLMHGGYRLRRTTPARTGAASARKRWAVRCYGSQLRAFASIGRPGLDDAFREESLWRLAN
jgi:LmbE family N-acetylglucosaminyl deacetylase